MPTGKMCIRDSRVASVDLRGHGESSTGLTTLVLFASIPIAEFARTSSLQTKKTPAYGRPILRVCATLLSNGRPAGAVPL